MQDILNRTTDAFRKGDLHLASKVEPLEAVVNELVRAIDVYKRQVLCVDVQMDKRPGIG